MNIEIKWNDFIKPDKNDITEFNLKFPNLINHKLSKIKTRNQNYDANEIILELEFLFNKNKDLKLIAEIQNHINVVSFYIKHLWFYSTKKPNRFKGGIYTSSSISFETYYEIIYSKLYSSFDRYLQLVSLYFNLKIEPKDINKTEIKNKIRDNFKSEYLDNRFNEIINDKSFSKISKIRNSFIHRETIFENKHKVNEVGVFYDTFQYKNMAESTIKNYIDFIIFLNSKAIPFLYEFKNHKQL